MGTPILAASCWIGREYDLSRRGDQGVVYLDQAAVETCILTCVISAQNLQLAYGRFIDLGERRETLRGECLVVAGPVISGDVRQRRRTRRRGLAGPFAVVARYKFRKSRASRGIQVFDIIDCHAHKVDGRIPFSVD